MENDVFDDRILRIVNSLLRKTKAGSITWETSTAPAMYFQYHTPSSTIEIRSRDNDSLSPYILVIRDSTGAVIEMVRADTWDTTSINSSLGEIYQLARRQSLKIDEKLDTLLSELEEESE